MKGLILKDFYMIWKYMKSFLFIAAVFLVYSTFIPGNAFFTYYPAVLVSMIPMSLITYDEKFGWHKYCDAMPCTRAQVVSAKYIIIVICVLALVALSTLSQIIRVLISGGSLAVIGVNALLLSCIGLIMPSIMLPVVFKMGPEKGRMAYYIVVGVMCGLAALVMTNGTISQNITLKINPLIILLGTIIFFALAWFLSIQMYKKRNL